MTTPRVLKAYEKNGFKIDLGSPSRLYSVLFDKRQNRTTSCSGGFPVTDAFTFTMISKVIAPQNIFIIGNSFGLSTFVLADLFPDSHIDVIDAEAEGLDVKIGSDLTKKMSQEDFPNVHLTVGYSPQDLEAAMSKDKYNFLFIDGLHTNEQMWLDFEGVLPKCADDCIVYFHDVASCKMFEAWEKVKSMCSDHKFKDFTLGFTQMGCAALVRGYPDLQEYLGNASNSFDGPYEIGFKDEKFKWQETKNRPFFWDLSFGHLERLVRRKIRRIFGRS